MLWIVFGQVPSHSWKLIVMWQKDIIFFYTLQGLVNMNLVGLPFLYTWTISQNWKLNMAVNHCFPDFAGSPLPHPWCRSVQKIFSPSVRSDIPCSSISPLPNSKQKNLTTAARGVVLPTFGSRSCKEVYIVPVLKLLRTFFTAHLVCLPASEISQELKKIGIHFR